MSLLKILDVLVSYGIDEWDFNSGKRFMFNPMLTQLQSAAVRTVRRTASEEPKSYTCCTIVRWIRFDILARSPSIILRGWELRCACAEFYVGNRPIVFWQMESSDCFCWPFSTGRPQEIFELVPTTGTQTKTQTQTAINRSMSTR